MERIALRTQFSTGVNLDEVRKVLSSALRNETELANARRTYFERACHAFEQQYQMSSDEFMQQFESGVIALISLLAISGKVRHNGFQKHNEEAQWKICPLPQWKSQKMSPSLLR